MNKPMMEKVSFTAFEAVAACPADDTNVGVNSNPEEE